MMKSQRKNIPLVRVKGFEGTWEPCTLGEHIEDYVEKTTVQNQYPVLTSSQNKGIVRQEDYFANRQVTTDSNIGYFVLPKGFFTYRSRSDNGVFKFNRNDLLDKGIISYFYPVFSIVEGDSDFYLRLLNTSITKQVMLQAEGTGQKVLSLSKFKSIKTLVPSLPEQSAIGSLFRTLDDLLASYKDNLTNYQSLKATMLSKVFPKTGQTVPEIRLGGFEGKWEKLKLRDVVHTNPKSELPENFKYIDLESVVGTRINKIREERKTSAPSRAQRLAKKGDVFYQTVRPYQKNNYLFKLDEIDYVFSTGYAQLRPIFNRCDSDFLLILLQNNRFLSNVLDRCTGTSYPAISVNDLIEILIAIPTYEEQQAIGTYFSNLDNLINSHQEKISQLETLKKKLLQDMFI